MKSGAVDADRFKVESRQSVNRRKMSKNSPVLNGADDSLNYAAEDDSVVRQVNLAAAYHDHISCTKSPDLCQKMDGAREGRGTLPCETDHIYANCSDIKSKSHTSAAPSNNNTKDLTLENMNLRDMLLSHLDIISHLQEELEKKNKEISERRRESDKHKMAPTKNNRTRDEILQKKREQEKARLLKIKSDPVKLAEQQAKERLKYLKKKEKGLRKSIKDMTPREQRKTRKNWSK
ncbi:unnamed protein product [Larinioides sclopetarius]|uniref:Uncharacterized protein n=1 Tax=Larinioides sclopetarius TaxID=280406 RepID=A0AAV2A2B4_9ARAC